MRIASLLASGTELVCALGAAADLVARSHECDDPPWVTRLPVLSRPTFDVSGSSEEIDRLVKQKLHAGEPLYAIDHDELRALAPDLVITQVHCDVCAVSPAQVFPQLDAAHGWPALRGFKTVSMRGGSLEGILDDFAVVAAAIGCHEAGQRLVSALRSHVSGWRDRLVDVRRPSVVCLEWTDPIFPMGNWGPELLDLAGGTCVLGNANAHSSAISWQAVLNADPEVLIVAPCGYDLRRALAEMPNLTSRPGWNTLTAVKTGQVYVADGNRYFNRSGPTLFKTIDLLSEILHPHRIPRTNENTLYTTWPPKPPIP